jgi:hypothetical protein
MIREDRRVKSCEAAIVRLLNGAQPHTSVQAVIWIGCNSGSGKMCSIHLSPDLVLSDFCLFGPFKNFLTEKRFEDQKRITKTSCTIFHISWNGIPT